MTPEEAISALHKIIDASIADKFKNAEVKQILDDIYRERNDVCGKGLWQIVNDIETLKRYQMKLKN
jgi:hypothetical protein